MQVSQEYCIAEWWSYHSNQLFIALVTAAVESVPYREVDITLVHAILEHSHFGHKPHKPIESH